MQTSKAIQKDRVLKYIITRGEITVREAVTELGVLSLPARIMDLRKDGYPIIRIWKTSNGGARYGVYKLVKEVE